MIDQKFVDMVDVEYIDLDDEEFNRYNHISQIIDNPSVPLPIVTINGTLSFTGPIYFPAIFDELKKLIS